MNVGPTERRANGHPPAKKPQGARTVGYQITAGQNAVGQPATIPHVQVRVKWMIGAAIMRTTPTAAKTAPMTRIMATWRAMRCSCERDRTDYHGGIRVSGLSSGRNSSSVFLACHSTQPRKFVASARPPAARTRPTATMKSLGST
jgi:hypothetical protein